MHIIFDHSYAVLLFHCLTSPSLQFKNQQAPVSVGIWANVMWTVTVLITLSRLNCRKTFNFVIFWVIFEKVIQFQAERITSLVLLLRSNVKMGQIWPKQYVRFKTSLYNTHIQHQHVGLLKLFLCLFLENKCSFQSLWRRHFLIEALVHPAGILHS